MTSSKLRRLSLSLNKAAATEQAKPTQHRKVAVSRRSRPQQVVKETRNGSQKKSMEMEELESARSRFKAAKVTATPPSWPKLPT